MIAYHGNPKKKAAILKQLRAHAKADEIVKGVYWENGKGCAVGCTVHSSEHSAYESEFGIPRMLARLEDAIFEGLPNAKAKKWPIQFMSAIKPGADLHRVGWKFLYWLLTDERVNPSIKNPPMQNEVKACADVLLPLAAGLSSNAESAALARKATNAAYNVYTPLYGAAASAACSAAYSAADAAYNVYSLYKSPSFYKASHNAHSFDTPSYGAAASAVYNAVCAVYSADGGSASCVLMSEKLLELLREAA